MFDTSAIWAALAVFGLGLAYKVSAWFRHGFAPAVRGASAPARVGAAVGGILSTIFSSRIVDLLRALVLDVLLQRRVLARSRTRWLAHLALSAAFVLLLLMHALGRVITIRVFPGYASTLNPFLFLRDLLGALLLVGLGIAAYRRYVLDVPRRRTRASDTWALALLGVILASGVLLEAVKITSYSEFQRMAREYADADRRPSRSRPTGARPWGRSRRVQLRRRSWWRAGERCTSRAAPGATTRPGPASWGTRRPPS